MIRQRILIVEDEPDILEIINYNLLREGYETKTCRDGEEALNTIRRKAPDLVVLDIMLPGLDGIEVCRRLKFDPATRSIPVIMVTVKGDESDVVLGLGVGADDYVIKPFSPKELVARVKAVLRRGAIREDRDAVDRIARGGVVIDALSHKVTIDGGELPFTLTEFRLLHLLASHPGRVFTRGDIISRVIGDDAVILDRNIDAHVKMIRKKLGPYRDMVETVRGVGYRFKV